MHTAQDEEERRGPGRLTDEEVAYLRSVIARERELDKLRHERNHYRKIFYESAIRWSIPLVLSAIAGVLIWTGKLWLLAAIQAVRGVP